MRNLFSKSSVRAVAAASLFGLSWTAYGQATGAPAPKGPDGQPLTGAAKEAWDKNAQLLSDFVHYVLINRADVAAGVGQQLLNQHLPPTAFVDLVETSGEQREGRFEETIGRAMRVPELEGTAAALLKLYDRGKLERVRNPDEIARNIALLSGLQRARILAQERLVRAGEYAVPQLLGALIQNQDFDKRSQVETVLVQMGQQAVTPLCTALVGLNPEQQQLVVGILGQIGYRTALPYLYDVLSSTSTAPVREACDRAIQRIGSAGSTQPADLYEQLGEAYYADKAELISFPGEEYQLLWNYNPSIGLVPMAIKTEVFNEAMAMRMAERSLTLNPQSNDQALSLWLASNFNREIQQPADYDNPAYPKTRRGAMYFAVAAGAGPCESVLARGLQGRNTQLVRRAIAAVEQNAGVNAILWTGATQSSPLVEALGYPNRRVQYEAALAMGKAQPQKAFPSSECVVPILASAIRDAGARFAAVVSPNREIGNGIRKTLEKAGYTVLPVSDTLPALAQPIAEAPGIDLIVSNVPTDQSNALVTEARRDPKLAATPILILTTGGQDNIDLSRRYERDVLVSVRPQSLSEPQLTEAASQLVDAAVGGPIKPEEARDYAVRALSVLRDLAVSGNTAFDVGEAALPLIGALTEANGPVKLQVAEVLSRIEQKRAQVALGDAALAANADERIALLGKVADSAKRFGNLLEQRQVQRVLELATSAPDKEATAAAALVGSLNLPNTNLVPLILGTSK